MDRAGDSLGFGLGGSPAAGAAVSSVGLVPVAVGPCLVPPRVGYAAPNFLSRESSDSSAASRLVAVG